MRNQVEIYLNQAKQQYEQGHSNIHYYNNALNSYNQAVNIDPLNEEIYYLRARTLVKLERLEEALSDLDKALKLDSQYEKAYYEKGNILSKLGKIELAKESYDKVLEINPDNADVQSMLAYNIGNYQEAIKYFNKLLVEDSRNLDIYYYKGKALSQIGKYEEAVSSYKAALEINPNFQLAIYGQAELYYQLKSYGLSYNTFNRVQNFADAKYYMAKIYYDFQQYQWVVNILKPCKTAREFNIKALAHIGLKEYWNAAALLEEAIQLDPKFTESYINYVDLLVDLGKYDGALVYCDKVININPNIVTIYYKKAEILSLLWKKPEAIENYNQAIKLNPEREVLYLCKKSVEYSLIGNDRESFDCLEKAYDLVKIEGLDKGLQENEISYINTILNRFVNEVYYEKIEDKKHLTLKKLITPIENQLKEFYHFVTAKFKVADRVIVVSKKEQELIDEYLALINCDNHVTLESLLQTTEEDIKAFKEYYYQDSGAGCANICKIGDLLSANFVSVSSDICLAGNLYQLTGD